MIVNDILHQGVPQEFHRLFTRHAQLDATILPMPVAIGIGARL